LRTLGKDGAIEVLVFEFNSMNFSYHLLFELLSLVVEFTKELDAILDNRWKGIDETRIGTNHRVEFVCDKR